MSMAFRAGDRGCRGLSDRRGQATPGRSGELQAKSERLLDEAFGRVVTGGVGSGIRSEIGSMARVRFVHVFDSIRHDVNVFD